MKRYIKTFESFISEDKYLFHGTSYDNALNIMNNGFTEETYWGDESIAEEYANSYSDPVLIKIPFSEIINLLEPNNTLIDYFYDRLEEDDNDDDANEVVSDWERSDKSTLNSLEIIGSAILPPCNLTFNDESIIKLK